MMQSMMRSGTDGHPDLAGMMQKMMSGVGGQPNIASTMHGLFHMSFDMLALSSRLTDSMRW